jgi:hypothetical protein
MKSLKSLLVSQLIKVFLSLLTPDLLKQFVDKLLDFVEDAVLGSASELDDKLVLPLCQMIRDALNIPDED